MVTKGSTAYRQRSQRRLRKTRWDSDISVEDIEDRSPGRRKGSFAFCFLFTNQAGTVIFSFSGFALIITTMLFHWYAPSLTSSGVRALQNVLLHTYFFVMLAGFILAFVAAYMEKGTMAKVAALLVLIGTIFYFIFFILSFFTDSMVMLYVCPEMRCADHHWLQDSMWRGYVLYSENIDRYRKLEKEIKEIEDKINSIRNNQDLSQDLFSQTETEVEKPYDISLKLEGKNLTVDEEPEAKPEKKKKGRYIHLLSPGYEGNGSLIVVSVLFGLLIMAYFIYAIVTFFAYGMYLSSREK